MKILNAIEKFLKKLDYWRDQILFSFIKPFWPRFITPNQITWVRVFISIALFILLFFFRIEDKTLIITLFCIGVATDMLDGSVARGLDMITPFGAMLDPTADRLLILPIAVYSLYLHDKWLLLALLMFEVLNTLVSIFYKSKEVYMESNIYGKTKMVIQSIGFIAILIVFPNEPHWIFIDLLWLSIVFTILNVFVRIAELKEKGHIKNKLLFNKHENI